MENTMWLVIFAGTEIFVLLISVVSESGTCMLVNWTAKSWVDV